jgi:hypothetical protein
MLIKVFLKNTTLFIKKYHIGHEKWKKVFSLKKNQFKKSQSFIFT